MSVSMGNGVDLGNLVTSTTNPLTGGIEITGLGKPKWTQDITYGRTVFSSHAASNWSNASSTAPGTIVDSSDYSFGDDQSVLKMTFKVVEIVTITAPPLNPV